MRILNSLLKESSNDVLVTFHIDSLFIHVPLNDTLEFLSQPEKSGLAKHCLQMGPKVLFNDTRVPMRASGNISF